MANPDLRPYSFFNASREEVARALLRTNAGIHDPDSAGIIMPRTAVAVDRLEVRIDLRLPRRRGLGRSAVRMLEVEFPMNTMYAFAEGDAAERFWRSTYWDRITRADGSTRERPLFVLTRTPGAHARSDNPH